MAGPITGVPPGDAVSVLLEYLDLDAKPAFVLYLPECDAHHQPSNQHVTLQHANTALRNDASLYAKVFDATKDTSSLSAIFDTPASKAAAITGGSNARTLVSFCGLRWALSVVRQRWAVVGLMGQHEDQISEAKTDDLTRLRVNGTPTRESQSAGDGFHSRAYEDEDNSPLLPLGEISSGQILGDPKHLAWVRQYDWESSPCGPISTWPPELIHAAEMAFASPDPVCILWGEQYTLVYNRAYSPMPGDKNPGAFGRPYQESWGEHWDLYEPVFSQIKRTGQTITQESLLRELNRDGFMEETYFDATMMPIVGMNRLITGIYIVVHETTRQVLSKRRIQSLVEVTERMATSNSLYALWRVLLDALRKFEKDVQFAALYSTDIDRDDGPEDLPEFTLEATTGRDGVDDLSLKYDSQSIESDMKVAILEVFRTGKSKVLRRSDGTLTDNALSEYKSGEIDLSCREVVIQPLICEVEENVAAVLVIAVNPLRRLDDDYHSYIQLLVSQIESSVTTIRGIEKEKKMAQLHAATEVERRFQVFAERAPIGIYMYDAEGVIQFCNNAFTEITGRTQEDLASPMAWVDMVHPDCIDEIKQVWEAVLKRPCTSEIQFKQPWTPNKSDSGEALDRTWALATAYPDISEDGQVRGIIGCVMNTSPAKWAEQLQAKKLSEALELKRQQENFLDITSHEMRNPLNSILHCASELTEQLSQNGSLHLSDTARQECLEMATTIGYCANHQKRIVDDVLLLSKLDARLLQMFPESTDPIKLVEDVMGIFYSELRASGIQLDLKIGERYRQLGLGLVNLDPHRVTQIIINLISNAIKFTKTGPERFLHLVLDASLTDLTEECQEGFRFVPSGVQYQDPTRRPEWGDGEEVFLTVSIQDTGPGITQDEIGRLFNRFSQASPRTHTQYGGSGLGLFISRELTEMHGGRIGLSSKPGSGSLFKFVVKTRRSTSTPVSMPDSMEKSPSRNLRLIPFRTPPARENEHTKPVRDRISISRESGSEPSPSISRKILIVEDNVINQRLLQKLVLKRGYEAVVAANGEEALALIVASTWSTVNTSGADKLRMDIILCDVEMPIMDGKTCVRRIRQLQKEGLLHQHIPVIAVTGNARNEQVEEARQCGFDAVLTKPYQAAELFNVVERHLSGNDFGQGRRC